MTIRKTVAEFIYPEVFRDRESLTESLQLQEQDLDASTELLTLCSISKDTLNQEIDVLKEKIFEQTEKGNVPIETLKTWYYTKWSGSDIWSYRFNHHVGHAQDVRKALQPVIEEPLIKGAKELIKEGRLKKGCKPEKVIEVVVEYFMRRNNWTYVRDIDMWGVREFFARPDFSWVERRGDCFTGDTKIIVKDCRTGIISNKKLIDLKDYYYWYLALSYNEKTGETEFKPITNFLVQGEKEVWEVTPKRGEPFKCTNNHKFLVQGKGGKGHSWKELKEVTPDSSSGRQVKSLAKIDNDYPCRSPSKALLTLIGAYIADGTGSEEYRFSIAGDDKEITKELHNALSSLGIKYTQSKREVHAYTRVGYNDNPEWLKSLITSMGTRSDFKKFPEEVFNLSDEDIDFLLQEYGKRDGTKNPKDRSKISVYSTVSDELKEQLQLLLARLGVCHYSFTQHQDRPDAKRKPIHRVVVTQGKGVKGVLRNNAITSITKAGVEETYDITVQDNHNFVLSNSFIIAHNCDSLAILMHNLIYHMFNILGLSDHYWRLKFTASGTLVEGHAYNIWLGEDGKWYVIESTLDLRGSFMKTWLKTPLVYNNFYGNPYGFADLTRSWRGTVMRVKSFDNSKFHKDV